MPYEQHIYLFLFLSILAGYILGSMPFGLILCKIFGHGDIRQIGSGNIGATNVLRTGNKFLAFITLILDTSKGAIAVFSISFIVTGFYYPQYLLSETDLIYLLPDYLPLIAGLFAIIGHCYPVWLKFKGGKGVATTLGTLLAAVPFAGLAACVTWLIVALLFRISSLSALVAMITTPIVCFFFYGLQAFTICGLISALVWFKHKENIIRLLKGEEPKIGQKKKDNAQRSNTSST